MQYKRDFYFCVSALNQSYWILGSVIGAAAGQLLGFDTTGVDFAMTALFIASFTEQWITANDHIPAVTGLLGTLLCLIVFGPDRFLIPAMLLILMESPIQALWFGVFVLALQQLDGNIIGPMILGDATGVSSFWVLFSILLFGGLWGIVGMVVAVPLFAVLYNIIRRLVVLGLKRHDCVHLMEDYHNSSQNKK